MNAPAIVLNGPRHPENIGAVARIMKNFGFNSLHVVCAGRPERSVMEKTATHHSADIVDRICYAASLKEALEEFSFVVGLTGRTGRNRQTNARLSELSEQIGLAKEHNRTALLFGAENTGLTNSDLEFCQLVVTIPTVSMSSINLAQAVAITCYELQRQRQQRADSPQAMPKLANSFESTRVRETVRETLNLLDKIYQTDQANIRLRHLLRFLNRRGLTASECAALCDIGRLVNGALDTLATD